MKWRDDFIFFLFLTLPHLKHISQKSRSWRLNILVDQISLLIYSNVNLHAKWKKLLVFQSCLTLCDPVDVAHQAPLSMGFSRQEYWSGFPCLLQGIFLTQGSNPGLLHCRQIIYCLSHQGSPIFFDVLGKNICHNSYTFRVIFKNKTSFLKRKYHHCLAFSKNKT